MGLKQSLIRGLWLTHAAGRGRGTVVIIGMRGKSVMAEAGMMLQEPEVRHVFSWGICPWITGPLQWCVAQAPGVGEDSDLLLHTGFLVAAAAAALVLYTHLWVLS